MLKIQFLNGGLANQAFLHQRMGYRCRGVCVFGRHSVVQGEQQRHGA